MEKVCVWELATKAYFTSYPLLLFCCGFFSLRYYIILTVLLLSSRVAISFTHSGRFDNLVRNVYSGQAMGGFIHVSTGEKRTNGLACAGAYAPRGIEWSWLRFTHHAQVRFNNNGELPLA